MKPCIVAAAYSLIIVTSGCGDESLDIDGSWQYEDRSIDYSLSLTLADGAFEESSTYRGEPWERTGEYSLDGRTLTQRWETPSESGVVGDATEVYVERPLMVNGAMFADSDPLEYPTVWRSERTFFYADGATKDVSYELELVDEQTAFFRSGEDEYPGRVAEDYSAGLLVEIEYEDRTPLLSFRRIRDDVLAYEPPGSTVYLESGYAAPSCGDVAEAYCRKACDCTDGEGCMVVLGDFVDGFASYDECVDELLVSLCSRELAGVYDDAYMYMCLEDIEAAQCSADAPTGLEAPRRCAPGYYF